MKVSRKAKAIVSVVIVLLLISFSCSPTTAKEKEKGAKEHKKIEPYGPAIQGALSIGLPGGNTISSGGGSSGGASSSSGGGSSGGGISPGVKITISGGGFAPYAKYDILWDGKVLIDPYADENGFASYEFTIPTSADTGIHTVSMQGNAGSGGTLVLSSNVAVKAKKIAGTVKRGTENKTLLPAEDTEGQERVVETATPSTEEMEEDKITGAKGVAKTVKRGTEKMEKKAKAFPFTGGGLLLYALIACIVLASVGLGMKFLLRAR